MTRWLRHPLFAPALVLAALGWGTAVLVFLRVGPNLGGWATVVLDFCFGWNAATRGYRLGSVLLFTLEPPLFAIVVAFFYAEELRVFLCRTSGQILGAGAGIAFVVAALVLVLTGEVVGAAPTRAPAPLRQSQPLPRVTLVDHRGTPFTLGEPLDRPVALTFIYTDCHATCPALVAALKSTESLVGERARFAAVTLDPATDTVPVLAEYAERWSLGRSWRLLTGPQSAVDALLTTNGVRVARLRDGEIAHDNVVLLLDRGGRVAFTHRGSRQVPADLARTLERLAAEGA